MSNLDKVLQEYSELVFEPLDSSGDAGTHFQDALIEVALMRAKIKKMGELLQAIAEESVAKPSTVAIFGLDEIKKW